MRRSPTIPWLPIALIVAISLGATPPAAAQRVVHRTRFGDTIKRIAKQYYGDPAFALFIKLINGRDNRPLRAGERIRVPSAWTYVVPRRTTVGAVAKRLLGDRRRAVALVAFNRLGRRARLRAGRRLTIPFEVDHLVAAGETFASISGRYFGNAARATLIADYNGLRGAQPAAGASLKIPIARVRITPKRLLKLTNSRVLGVSAERQQADRTALQEANSMLRRGEYLRVPMRLIRLLAKDQQSDSHVAEIYKLLAIAYVAMGEHMLAIRAFVEALLRRPNMTLDAVRYSPKVIRAFTDAKARRRGR